MLKEPSFLFLNDPDIAIADGIAVALQNNRTSGDFFAASASARSFRKLNIVMNLDAVVNDGNSSVLDFLFSVESWRCKVNVVALPCEGRKTHIGVGKFEKVETAAPLFWIGLGFFFPSLDIEIQPEAIENLSFVSIERVDAAVAPILAAGCGLGFEGKSKFDVELEVAEILSGLTTGFEQAI